MKTRIQNHLDRTGNRRNARRFVTTGFTFFPCAVLCAVLCAEASGADVFSLGTSSFSENERNTARHLEQLYRQPEGLTLKQRQMFGALGNVNTASRLKGVLADLSGAGRANTLMMGMYNPAGVAMERLLLRGPDTYYGAPQWRTTRIYRSWSDSGPEIYDGHEPASDVMPRHENDAVESFESIEPIGPMRKPLDPRNFESPEEMIDLNDSEPDDFDDSNSEPAEDFGSRTRSRNRGASETPAPTQEIILFEYFGQCPTIDSIHFWANPFHNIVEVDGDRNSGSYDIHRSGVLFGGHRQIGKHSALGVMIGYSDPVFGQSHTRATANDYQIGLYGGTLIRHRYELKGYIGFGHQEYTFRRSAHFEGFADTVAGRTHGDSFAMSFQLTRPFHGTYLGGLWKPHIAIDTTRADQDGFIESGDSFGNLYSDASLTKTFFRIGVSREIDRCDWRFRAGLGYSTLIGGDDAPMSSGKIVGAAGPGTTSYGVDTSEDYFNGNVGLEWFMNRSRTSSVFGDYQVFASKRETNQTVSLGFRWMM